MEEALSRPDSEKWKLAMKEDYYSLVGNDTLELKIIPSNRQSQWIFKTKRDVTGGIVKYKTRFVINAEIYLQVVRHSPVRIFLCLRSSI